MPPPCPPKKWLAWKSKEVCEVMLGCWGWVWSMMGIKFKNQTGAISLRAFVFMTREVGLSALKVFKQGWCDQTCFLNNHENWGCGGVRINWKGARIDMTRLVKRLLQWSSWGIIVTWTRVVGSSGETKKCKWTWEMFRSVVEKTREDKKLKTMIRDISKGQKEEEQPEKETA